jgi:uncharacterized repeat protein (TIGR03803 family)
MASRGYRFGNSPTALLALLIATSIAGASQSFAQASATYTVLADIDRPFGGVIKGSDGALYGTSRVGPGASTCGYVYRLDPQIDGTFALSILHEFAGGLSDGCQPNGELVEGADGAFYGTTRAGGPNRDSGAAVEGTGSIYKMMPNGQYAFIRFFAGATGSFYLEGLGPTTGLASGPDGNFYGTANAGGLGGGVPGLGTIFSITPDGMLNVLDDFSPEKGSGPQDALTLIDGYLYGTSITPGASNPAGALFRVAPGSTISHVFAFPWQSCGDPQCYPWGANPWAAPTGISGHVYILGRDHGLGGGGTIVRVNPDGTGALLYDFSGSNGSGPHRGLTLGADGFLYGVTSGGGAENTGTVFRMTSTGTFEKLHDFGAPYGAVPEGRLLEIAPGEFIGTASSGNPAGGGVVFRLSLNSGPPIADDAAFTTNEDEPFTGTLTASSPGGAPLTYSIVTNGTLGTAVITDADTGAFSYTPNADASGADTFTFKANDGTADSNIATITVTITPVNDAPIAADGSLSTTQSTIATGTLVATDIDGPALTFTIGQNGTKGMATITDASTGAFTYTPNAGASGADTFTFSASDGSLPSNIATIAVNIIPLTVTVISPNGGERVFVSHPITISWSATGAASFDVWLSRNGVNGNYFLIPECIGLPGSATSCLWTPQAPGSNSSSIRVRAHAGTATVVDTSNAVFQLTTATPSITVTAPNTAVAWAEGAPQTIRWTHNLGVGSSVRVELSRNGGATWEVLAASVQNTSASMGSFPWMVTGPQTTTALVRVSWLAGPASDVSNTNFAIVGTTLTVTSPNTAVMWAAGVFRTLTTSHNLGAGQSIAFDVSRDGGSTWAAIGVATSSATTANLPWTVTGPPTTQARIRATWTANPAVSDMSNVNFTITPRVTVTMPNTPVMWGAGTLRTVTWTHTLGLGQLVNIDVSTNNGATWSPVATNVPNTTPTSGSAVVRMPETVTTQALVRVSPVSFPVADGDVSNVPFTLVSPTVSVTMPNSNVLWTIGSNASIGWTHNLGTAESVNLEISRDGGMTWTAIATNVLNSANGVGTFLWTVTGPATIEARIRVTWTVNGAVQDMSNVNFRIQ